MKTKRNLLGLLLTCWAIHTSTAASPLLQTHELKPNGGAIPAVVNCVTELAFTAGAGGGDPFLDSEIDALFADPGGQELRIRRFGPVATAGRCAMHRASPDATRSASS